jgi:NADH:ubiquinone oxidoreductase subunit 2 (subunit N)
MTCYLILNDDLIQLNFVSFNNFIVNDFLAYTTKFLICFFSAIYFLIISNSLKEQKLTSFEYLLIILFAILGLMLMCSSNDLLTVYLSMELSSLSLYILASFKKNSSYSIESGLKYFITGALSSAFFLLGSSFIYVFSGSIHFNDFFFLFEHVRNFITDGYDIHEDFFYINTFQNTLLKDFLSIKDKYSIDLWLKDYFYSKNFIKINCNVTEYLLLKNLDKFNLFLVINAWATDFQTPTYKISLRENLSPAQIAFLEYLIENSIYDNSYCGFIKWSNCFMEMIYPNSPKLICPGCYFYTRQFISHLLIEEDIITLSLWKKAFLAYNIPNTELNPKMFLEARLNCLEDFLEANARYLLVNEEHSKNFMQLWKDYRANPIFSIVHVKSNTAKYRLLKVLIIYKDWFHIFTLLEDDFSFNLPAEITLTNSQFNFLNSMSRYTEKQGIYLWFNGFFNMPFLEDIEYFLEFLSKLIGNNNKETLHLRKLFFLKHFDCTTDQYSLLRYLSFKNHYYYSHKMIMFFLQVSLITYTEELIDLNFVEIGLSLIIFSLFIKLACAPFHVWSLDVYQGSPTNSSFFFAVITKLSIFVLLIRLCCLNIYTISYSCHYYCFSVGLLSIFVGSFGGLKEKKIKTLLAYSSITNMGYGLLALGTGTSLGIQTLFVHLVIYMLSGLCTWSIIIFLRLKTKTPNIKHIKELSHLALLRKSNIALTFALSLTMFSIAGIPPIIGFLAKIGVFLSVIQQHYFCFVMLSAVLSVVATFYYIRIIKVLCFENLLIGKLYYPLNTSKALILSLLILSLLLLFLNPSLLYLLSYKIVPKSIVILN